MSPPRGRLQGSGHGWRLDEACEGTRHPLGATVPDIVTSGYFTDGVKLPPLPANDFLTFQALCL